MSIVRKTLAAMTCGMGATLCALPSLAAKADYPNKTVQVYVDFAAGDPTNVVARMLADDLPKKLVGRSSLTIKWGRVMNSYGQLAQEGRFRGLHAVGANGTLSILPVVKKGLAHKLLTDFTSITVDQFPYYPVVPKDSKFNSYEDLIKAGSSPGGGLTFGFVGLGSANHPADEWFSKSAGMNATHIPYKGDSVVLNDLITNRFNFAFLAGSVAIPQVDAKNLWTLGSASLSPDIGLENVPVLGKGFLPRFSAEPWNGLLGPGGPSKEIVSRLNTASTK